MQQIRRLAFLFIFLSSVSHSQTKTAGSFKNLLDSHPEMDTVRVNLLNKYAAEIKKSDAAQAEKLLIASEKLAKKLHYNKGALDSYLQLGQLYNAEGQYDKAIAYAAKGTSLSKKENLSDYKKAFFLLLAETQYDKERGENIKTKDFLDELHYKIFLRDSLQKSQKSASSLKTVVKQQDDELLVNRLIIILGIIGFAVVVLLAGFIATLVKVRKVKMENKQLLTEQKLRRSQMNPHFIFNCIQNVRSLIVNKQETEAVNYINKFSSLTRQILESSDDNYTSLTEEVELIRNYIALQQLLYTNTFTYTITVDDAIDTDSIFLPPMLSQPFIENAIRHGLSHKAENALLGIWFYLKNDKLFFEVTDNGSGFNESKKSDNHKSMAMEITRKRLVHYTENQNFVVHANNILDANSNVVGAKISFEVPYIYEK